MIGINHILLCYGNIVAMVTRVKPNYSFVLTHIEFILVWRLLGTIGISHIPRCYGNSVTMATRVKHKKLICFKLY